MLSSSYVSAAFIVKMFDSQERSCHPKAESSCHLSKPHLSVFCINVILVGFHSKHVLRPFVNLFTSDIQV